MARRRWIGVLVGLALAVGGVLAATPAANAAVGITCQETSCDGLDPTLTFDATTLGRCSNGASSPLSGSAFGGILELRWGPNCSTNWTRFTPADNGTYEIRVIRLSDGVWAGTGKFNYYTFSGAGVGWYSDQVYSPGPAAACVFSVARGQEVCFRQTS